MSSVSPKIEAESEMKTPKKTLLTSTALDSSLTENSTHLPATNPNSNNIEYSPPMSEIKIEDNILDILDLSSSSIASIGQRLSTADKDHTGADSSQSFNSLKNINPSFPNNPKKLLSAHTTTPVPSPIIVASSVVSTEYSGIKVWELEVNEILVMRRCLDDFINCTQILKVAKIDKGQRTKILEREVYPTTHEKIQGGYGKYQGTWIPLVEGIKFAHRFNVVDLIKPLLAPDLKLAPAKLKLTSAAKRQALSQPGPHSRMGSSSAKLPRTRSDVPALRLKSAPTTPQLKRSCSQAITSTSSRKSGSNNRYSSSALHEAILLNSTDTRFDLPLPNELESSDLNEPIDSNGTSPVHFLAMMGRATALRQLANWGANLTLRDHHSQTPLMRAVSDLHCFHTRNFSAILHILGPNTFSLQDARGMTMLHYIARAATNSLKQDAALYYLSCLTQFLSPGGLLPLLNLQDECGDTPAHIAARINFSSLLERLINFGTNVKLLNVDKLSVLDLASPHENKNGSSDAVTNSRRKNSLMLLAKVSSTPIYNSDNTSLTDSSFSSKANEITSVVDQLVTKLEREHRLELQLKNSEIAQLYEKLDAADRTIASLRHQLAALPNFATNGHSELDNLDSGDRELSLL